MTDPSPDREVVRVLVENRARFLSFLQRRTGSREAAEEILQVAFVRSIEKGDTLREDESAVAWCYRLLRNALIDRHRRSGAEHRAMSRHAQHSEHENTAAGDTELTNEVCTCMHSLMPTLKPEYADVLRRIDLEGAPTEGVAKEIGITPNNATVRLHRARQALRKRLEECCGACATHGCLNCTCQHRPGPRPLPDT